MVMPTNAVSAGELASTQQRVAQNYHTRACGQLLQHRPAAPAACPTEHRRFALALALTLALALALALTLAPPQCAMDLWLARRDSRPLGEVDDRRRLGQHADSPARTGRHADCGVVHAQHGAAV